MDLSDFIPTNMPTIWLDVVITAVNTILTLEITV